MRRLIRALKKRFGVAAPQVAVRTALPWYWRMAGIVLLVGFGYGIGLWRFAGNDANVLATEVQRLQNENKALQEKAVFAERQQQVEHAAQSNLAKEMATLQDESVRLKEDLAFYKSIMVEGAGAGMPKINSFKLAKGGHEGEYQYTILLVQTGKHDKTVQGSLQLVLSGTQSGKQVELTVSEAQAPLKGVKVNFKYYQRIEGKFNVPAQMTGPSLQARFFEPGMAQPKLVQSASFPG